ncbi:HAD-superfamily subfamily IIA hydrolase, TIGR01458 [Reichenbachiella faecimaris]|uniref:Haloacid dehalogenase-like hydrolase domain-containing protein 2 n=1 Tax=Reichenbachiella faecimaris TaxID=692418 RepID=A0A1W2G5R1_REIFA|nr:TIGR01458 family HAD-type hydrolase [Reichenbachiella faecimaris]SMD31782.1 HAD-superfamily subfamily IIA hydrolase, TIGR01458 [Reichenbachiella faecimaris]
MNQIKGLLIDIDGVLVEDGHAIKGAVDHLNNLKHTYKVRLLTNTTTKTVGEIHQMLNQLGFDIHVQEIVTAPVAAQLFLNTKGYSSIYPVVNANILSEFKAFRIDKNKPEAVVIGDIGKDWNYDLLNDIFKCLMIGAELVALHKGKFWKSEGALQLDIGLFVNGLEFATGKKATVIGKPNHSFFEAALQGMELGKKEVIMIGDDIDSDVDGAQRFGIPGYLVQTGKYDEGFVSQSDVEPDQVIEGFKDLILY